jgi:signal transduction histidine kinase/HPt (histidine-containing phosphotransfer) domain-containing protein/FixJ family two-component response regulator
MMRFDRRLGLPLVGLLAALVLWAAVIGQIGRDRARSLAETAERASIATLALETHLRRVFAAVDAELVRLAREAEGHASAVMLTGLSTRLGAIDPALTSLAVIDPDGRVVGSTLGPLRGVVLADDRDYLQGNLAFDPARPILGRPAIEPGSGRPALTLSRRITRPGGGFGGVIVAFLDPAELVRGAWLDAVGADAVAALVGTDAVVLARAGDALPAPGEALSDPILAAALRGSAAGTILPAEPPESAPGLIAFRHLPDLPGAAVIGVARRTIEQSATAGLWRTLFGALAVSVALAALVAALVLEARRGVRREAELDADRAALEAANRAIARAKRQADEKSALLETTLANLSDGVTVFDANLRLVTWNDRLQDLLGLPDEVLYEGAPYEGIIRAQAGRGEFGTVDIETEVRRRLDVVRSGRFGVYERTRPDGRVMELKRTGLPGGGFVTIYTDVTPRRRAEEQMRRARELAEAASAAKSSFVAVVSHEIRTPMNAVIGTLGLLAGTELDAEQRRYVETAHESAEHLLAIINDILDLSKIEAGRLALETTDFALAPLMAGAVDLFRPSAQVYGATIRLEIGEGVPPYVRGDAGRLRQILLNLISNAVKFSQGGDIVVSAEGAPPPGVGLAPRVRFAVADRGPGIPESERGRLFQPFSQLEPPDARRTGGTGLGLAICRRLVELLGGTIGVEDRPGGGSIFRFTLPLAPAERIPEAAAEPALPARRARRARVLLAEDSPANQLVAATWLRKDGHHVDVVANGIEAVDAVRARPYDIIFMDMFMPEMDGMAATAAIRRLPAPAGAVPIVALTANVMAGDRERFLSAGMNGVLAKPVTGRILAEALLRHLHTAEDVGTEAGFSATRDKPVQPILDTEHLARLGRGLTTDTLASLIRTCIEDVRARTEAIAEAAAAADAERLRREAHALRGGAANYGLTALAELAARIEAATVAGDLVEASRIAAGLGGASEAACAALAASAEQAAAG